MLLNLGVRDFAIVDRIDVEFDAGMTVLTGETGAGKSILVDALGLVLGDRGSSDFVRSGAERAEFSAEFDVSGLAAARSWLEENALDAGGECVIRRVIGADGRSRAFVNGNPVPLNQLAALGEMLIDIHGQHFHQSLGKRAVQRDLLDHYGELVGDAAETAQAFDAWRDLAGRLESLLAAEANRDSRKDLLGFQVSELEALDLGEHEPAALREERHKLANSGRIAEALSLALERLSDAEDVNVAALLAEASRALETAAGYDPGLKPAAELLESAGIQVDEAVDSLRRQADELDMDPARRDWVEERLDALQSLSRKHRVDADELPGLLAKLRSELEDLDRSGERSRQLEIEANDAEKRYRELAAALSRKRKAAAKRLSKAVTSTMAGLGMPGGIFEANISALPSDEPRRHGIDQVEFLISANPGQPPMPLSRIASGGELSRMSLAIQVIAAGGTRIPTMVFDEVDAGIGGGVAEMVGRRLAELGRSRQVLAVTHLPQVASQAGAHFRVSKTSDGSVTRTGVAKLGKAERVEELARMLGGVEITKTTLKHAAEMLARAG